MIHETAIVSNKAHIDASVSVGPYCIIDENVSIGPNHIICSWLILMLHMIA